MPRILHLVTCSSRHNRRTIGVQSVCEVKAYVVVSEVDMFQYCKQPDIIGHADGDSMVWDFGVSATACDASGKGLHLMKPHQTEAWK